MAHAEQGHPIVDDDEAALEETEPGYVLLPYPEDLARDLWLAWDKKSVMPRAGGYLDQPRRWLRLIRFLNMRYSRAWDAAKAEREEDKFWDALNKEGSADWDDLTS